MADVYSSGMRPVSRAEARALGLKRYSPGTACKYGHVGERLVSNGSCLQCCSARALEKYWAHRDENLQKQKARRDRPGYYEQRRQKRHKKDPDLAARVAAERAELLARDSAMRNGQSTYFSDRRCSKQHEPIRFSRDGTCVECNRLACAARAAKERYPLAGSLALAISRLVSVIKNIAANKRRAEVLAKRNARQARRLAMQAGDKNYVGKPCPRGHVGLRYTNHGTCVDCAREMARSDAKKDYDRLYLERNREAILERTRRYAQRNAAKVLQAARDWAKKNPEKRKAIANAYKSRRRQLEAGGDSTEAIRMWESRALKRCYWCHADCADSYHVDHYEPLSKGGKHEVKNLVIACPRCNLRKSAKDPYLYAQSIGKLF